MSVTTINIVTDKLSNKKIQSNKNNSLENQENNATVTTLCCNATVQKSLMDSMTVKIILLILM